MTCADRAPATIPFPVDRRSTLTAQVVIDGEHFHLLFRVFDVLKPFPAGLIDGRIEGGVGVVGDDLVAGIYAGLAGRLVLELV